MSNGFPEWWKHGQKVHTRRDGVLTLNIAPDSEYWLTNDDGKEVYVFSADIISPVKKDAEGVIQMSMTTNKQTLREAAEKAISEEGETWWNEEQLASDYGLALHKADAEFIAAANPATVLALLDELEAMHKYAKDRDAENEGLMLTVGRLRVEKEASEKRIAELEASHINLREAMAGIHNTITGGGAYTPLAAILNASKRAYEESAAAAAKGE